MGDRCTGGVCEDRESGDHRLLFQRHSAGPSWPVSSGVGDLDGDGAEEIATGLPSEFVAEGRREMLVSLGGRSSAEPFGAAAMRIVDEGSGDWEPALGLRDLDGDGVGEVAVCSEDGLAVVFGRLDGSVVDLRELGSRGFRIVDPKAWGSGYGISCHAAAAGDLNGDGRDEIAFGRLGEAVVFFPPDRLAARTVDLSASGPQVARLTTSLPDSVPTTAAPGDLDGDGRDDLMVLGASGPAGADATAVMEARPGSDLELGGIAGAGLGFELHFDGPNVGLHLVGDVNGDGRRDIAWTSGENYEWKAQVAYSPARGVERTIAGTLEPGEGKALPSSVDGAAWNAGDLDGDGLDDVGTARATFETDGGDPLDPSARSWSFNRSRLGYLRLDVVDVLDDSNGDGLPELLTMHDDAANVYLEANLWTVQTFLSRPYVPIAAGVPVVRDDMVELHGSVAITPQNEALFRGAVASTAHVEQNGETLLVLYGGGFDASSGEIEGLAIHAFLPWIGAALEEREAIEYRLELHRDNAPIARGEWTNLGGAILAEEPKLRRVRGTKRADRLVGTPKADLIDGRNGADRLTGRVSNDRLVGGKGRDSLTGSSGNDYLSGGPGRDVLRCGAGIDAIEVDPRDRAFDCELSVSLG